MMRLWASLVSTRGTAVYDGGIKQAAVPYESNSAAMGTQEGEVGEEGGRLGAVKKATTTWTLGSLRQSLLALYLESQQERLARTTAGLQRERQMR
jgi:hypothetical protein